MRLRTAGAVLRGLCRGEPNKIIARALNLPESTVKVHVREIMRKHAVSNRTQIAVVVSRMIAWRLDEHGAVHAARGIEVADAEQRLRAPSICPADAWTSMTVKASNNERDVNGRG
jgi:DNA-binding CsgD family transcriptional regulator